MSQLRNLLTNKVLRYEGMGKAGRKLIYRQDRIAAGIRRAEARKMMRKGK